MSKKNYWRSQIKITNVCDGFKWNDKQIIHGRNEKYIWSKNIGTWVEFKKNNSRNKI